MNLHAVEMNMQKDAQAQVTHCEEVHLGSFRQYMLSDVHK